jgi:PAS domain S-box-containing protein
LSDRPVPSLASLFLRPALVLLAGVIGYLALVAVPRQVDWTVSESTREFGRLGNILAQEITRLGVAGTLVQSDAIDRFVARTGIGEIYVLRADGRMVATTASALRDASISDLAPLIGEGAALRAATNRCGSDVEFVAGRIAVGCWAIVLRPIDGTTDGRGVLIMRDDLSWIIEGARAQRINEALGGVGLLLIFMGILIVLAIRHVLAPVAGLGRQMEVVAAGVGEVRPLTTGAREIRSLADGLASMVSTLREREGQLTAILDTAIDGIIAIDSNGTIVQANEACRALVGWAPEDLVGQDVAMLMPPSAAGMHAHNLSTYLRTGKAGIIGKGREVIARRRDGSDIIIWLAIAEMRIGQQRMFTGTLRDVTADRLREFELHRIAHRDPILGLFNQRSWTIEIQALFDQSGGGLPDCFFLLVIVRNLDDLTVTFGDVEATVLAGVNARIEAVLGGVEMAARVDRTRLAYLIQGNGDGPTPEQQVTLNATFDAPIDVNGLSVAVEASLVVIPRIKDFADSTIAAGAVQAAFSWATETEFDRALPVLVYDEKVGTTIRERTRIAQELPGALNSGRIHPVYQPQISLRGGGVRGVETLVRWQRADGTPVSPAIFIPVAERAGFVRDVDRAVLETSVTALADGTLHLGADGILSVNASVKELGTRCFIDEVQATLERHGIAPARLEIEVTETAVTGSLSAVADILRGLRSLGVRVAIDDFGAGYASISYLKDLPADVLKIDRLFIADLASDTRARAIVETVIALGHDLGMEIIAEGVETAEVARILTEMGCDIAQGYFFARPMGTDALRKFVAGRLEALANV